MDLIEYLNKKYEEYKLEFYVHAEDWHNIFCYCTKYDLDFTIKNPPEYPYSLILTKQVHIEMVEYYDKYVINVILQHPMMTRKDKIKKIKSKI